jgi:hypothetical protein
MPFLSFLLTMVFAGALLLNVETIEPPTEVTFLVIVLAVFKTLLSNNNRSSFVNPQLCVNGLS